jgi:MFS family permease
LKLFQGISTGVFRPTSQALAYELNPARRAYILGLMGSSYVAGHALGPALGGFAADVWGLRVTMVIAGCAALLGAMYLRFVSRLLPNARCSKKPLKRQLISIFRQMGLRFSVPLIVVLTDAWILNSWHVYLPIFLKTRLGFTYTQIGMLIALESGVYVVSQPIAGRIIDRFGVKAPLIFSMLSHGFLIACIPALPNIWSIIFVLVAVGITNSAANPASVMLIAELSDEDQRGASLGLLSSASNFGQFIGPVLSGVLIGVTGYEGSALIACFIPGIIGALVPLSLKSSTIIKIKEDKES